MDTFISYASTEKRVAGRIKEHLDQFRFNCFLAHEDIPPQTKSPAEIVNALETCDLFLPVLTKDFTTSFFASKKLDSPIAAGLRYCLSSSQRRPWD